MGEDSGGDGDEFSAAGLWGWWWCSIGGGGGGGEFGFDQKEGFGFGSGGDECGRSHGFWRYET